MEPCFEARYIDIKWANIDQAQRINSSQFPIGIEKVSTNRFLADIVTFSKLETGQHGLFAIKRNESVIDTAIPFFLINGSEKKELSPIKDPDSGDVWWFAQDTAIYKDNRKRGKDFKYWVSDLFRTSGKIHLVVGEQKCTLYISDSSFTYEQLQQYLNSFQSEFVELILNNSGYVKADTSTPSFFPNMEELSVFARYLDHAEKIRQNPKTELREIQKTVVSKKLRPVPRSFMEIATKGNPKFITSRAYAENLNTPENRYVLYTLERVLKIIKALLKVSTHSSDRIEQSLERYQTKLESMHDTVKVNRDMAYAELAKVQHRLAYYKTEFSKKHALRERQPSDRCFCIKLTKKTDSPKFDFFVQVKNNIHDAWFKAERPDYMTVSFENSDLVEELKEYDEIEVLGEILFEETDKPNPQYHPINNRSVCQTRFWYHYQISNISQVNVTGGRRIKALEDKISHNFKEITQLENNNWIRRLTSQEKQEQEKEKLTINKKKELLGEQNKFLAEINHVLSPKIGKLKKLISFLKMKKVKANRLFPNSMSFVQNPHYQGIHRQYKIIKDISGLDNELFLAIEKIEEIGIIETSGMYERWCLIQVIAVLTQRLGYKPVNKDTWIKNFVAAIVSAAEPENVQIEFYNRSVARSIVLTYECRLKNSHNTKKGGNTKPDIVLDVFATSTRDENKTLTKRLVLDAKFKDYLSKGGDGSTGETVSSILNELYFDKDYREAGKNSVFILHPSKVFNPGVNPLTWAENSFLGELEVFNWDKELRKEHYQEYGSVYLSPIGNVDPLDNLQRLIGMFLQYSMDDNDLSGLFKKYENIPPDSRLFCSACGSDKYDYEWKQMKSGGWKFWLTCKECKHFSIYSYCRHCQTRLIKNGSFWTYHATEALNPFNIQCPKCEGLI